MKTYEVTDDDSIWCFVRAETASKARYKAAYNYDESDSLRELFPNGLRVRRRPELDGDKLTRAALMVPGEMFDDCPGCGRALRDGVWYAPDGDDPDLYQPVYAAPDKRGWCSRECWENSGTYDDSRGLIDGGICLYADI
jgi:hypothetical protein